MWSKWPQIDFIISSDRKTREQPQSPINEIVQ